jgi:hypothetical protein
MRYLLYLLLLISVSLSGQNVINSYTFVGTPVESKILISFAPDGSSALTGYNVIGISDRASFSLLDNLGGATGISGSVSFTWISDNSLGATTGSNSAYFLDDAIITSWYWQDATGGTITLSGLDNGKTYTIKAISSRAGDVNRYVTMTIGGVDQTIEVDDNTSNLFTYNNISPTSGEIVITLTRLQTYGYINAMEITWTP